MLAGCRRLNFIPRIQVLQQLNGCCLTSGIRERRTWFHRLSGIEFLLHAVIWCITYLLWFNPSFNACLGLLLHLSLLRRSLSPAHLFSGWRLTRHECLVVCFILLHVLGWLIYAWLKSTLVGLVPNKILWGRFNPEFNEKWQINSRSKKLNQSFYTWTVTLASRF